MSSEELKPCPFCGGDVSFHKDEECPGCHLIQCGQCRAFFDFATGADPGNDCASVDALRSAIAPMWNCRALAARQIQHGEAVEVRGLQWLDTGHYRKKPPQFGYNPHDWNPLMTIAQHQRSLAASVPAGCKVVPVELLERLEHVTRTLVPHLQCHVDLRALIASAEGVKNE